MSPLTDVNGVTAEVFMFKEFHTVWGMIPCMACGGYEDEHTPLLLFGHWHAFCNSTTVEEIACGLPLDVIQSLQEEVT